MLLPADLDLSAPRAEIVERLVEQCGYDRDAAEHAVAVLLGEVESTD